MNTISITVLSLLIALPLSAAEKPAVEDAAPRVNAAPKDARHGAPAGDAAPRANAASKGARHGAPAGDADVQKVRVLVETEINRVLKILKDETADQEAKRAEVMAVVNPLFDLPLMGKLVLGRRNWPKFDKGQRKVFIDLFVKTLQDSYFDKVDLLADEAVEFETPVRKKKKFHMLTHIVSKDRRYEMLYKLYKKKERWRVYDVEIEGISVIKSYGSQYDQFLQRGSVKELLVKMREKAIAAPKDLREKRPKSKKKKKAKPAAKKNG